MREIESMRTYKDIRRDEIMKELKGIVTMLVVVGILAVIVGCSISTIKNHEQECIDNGGVYVTESNHNGYHEYCEMDVR